MCPTSAIRIRHKMSIRPHDGLIFKRRAALTGRPEGSIGQLGQSTDVPSTRSPRVMTLLRPGDDTDLPADAISQCNERLLIGRAVVGGGGGLE